MDPSEWSPRIGVQLLYKYQPGSFTGYNRYSKYLGWSSGRESNNDAAHHPSITRRSRIPLAHHPREPRPSQGQMWPSCDPSPMMKHGEKHIMTMHDQHGGGGGGGWRWGCRWRRWRRWRWRRGVGVAVAVLVKKNMMISSSSSSSSSSPSASASSSSSSSSSSPSSSSPAPSSSSSSSSSWWSCRNFWCLFKWQDHAKNPVHTSERKSQWSAPCQVSYPLPDVAWSVSWQRHNLWECPVRLWGFGDHPYQFVVESIPSTSSGNKQWQQALPAKAHLGKINFGVKHIFYEQQYSSL